jgi:hypothetical protein
LAVALLAVPSRAGVGGANATWTTPHRIVIGRTVALPAGVAKASFDFTIHADYPDQVVWIIPRGAAISVRAISENGLMQMSGSRASSPSACRPQGSFDVCTQAQEWCGLVQGRWRATVTKTSQPPAVVRVRLAFARDVRPA